ncbi:MAG: 50S ribosomal protein L30 [Spirochaetaceae bacterium]|nr:MAG: 50S ribosomal protein L30 [Spirochaetaceae bacterium]
MADKVRITLVRSPIGRLPKHRRTVAALGLRKINQSVEKVKDASTLGMINAVSYLLRVEDV